jgi:hypothetical protein
MQLPSDSFSASEQVLAYLYQVRYALLLLLRADDEQSVSLELFDDVAIHNPDQIRELGQLKHHVARTGKLSDRSLIYGNDSNLEHAFKIGRLTRPIQNSC